MILVFGTICIDRVRKVPYLPQAGGYVEVEEQLDLLGGEGANTANALQNWGIQVEMFGNQFGEGPDGDLLRRLASEKGLRNHDLGSPDSKMPPVCDIYVTPDGDRTMFGLHFSTMEAGLSADPVSNSKAGWFTAEPNMKNLSKAAAKLAVQAGMKLYLMDFLDHEDVPVGSFWQCSTDWAGTRNNLQKNVVWVKDWVTKTGSFAILSDGPNGFVAGSPDRPVRAYPPFPAPFVLDTTGAGDAFRAGMLYGLEKNWEIPECLKFAAAAGCLNCRAIGATTDVPSVQEIQNLISEHSAVAHQYS